MIEAIFLKKKIIQIRPVAGRWIFLVRQDILLKNSLRQMSQLFPGKTNPAVFPNTFSIRIQIFFEISHHFAGSITGFGSLSGVGKIIGLFDKDRKINTRFVSDNDCL